ncbi:MAG: M13 family metallopeptidase [Myxococcales bacterium]|nr:M13 family metallopeptidase [Myxococcales bacterium]USN50749.1 MAG: M13 family metallopeptidase [Myxococcales bacterium]
MIDWQAPTDSASAIIELETKIAHAHWSGAESREQDKIYNLYSLEELALAAPQFPWQLYFQEAKLFNLEKVVLRQNTAILEMAKVFSETSLDTLKVWQAFHIINQSSPYLSKRFKDKHWQFFSHYLQGQPEQRSRQKAGVDLCNQLLGDIIGQEYVALYFNEDAKIKMDELVTNLKQAMRNRLTNLEWMSEATKLRALKKLEGIDVQIGFPSKWTDYSSLNMSEDLITNIVNSGVFEWNLLINKLAQPVDRNEWHMSPQTVNAYYSPKQNQIVFPAAILQPPFFNVHADAAVNYGSIGAVIGHEITHGFDDQGRKSDENGRLNDWWTPDDDQNFIQRAKMLGEQYKALKLSQLPKTHIDPELTMGENIADLGGVILAFEAYKLSPHLAASKLLDGFSAEQRFFLGFAQVWRTLITTEYMQYLLTVDPHSPGQVRAFASLRNVQAWYDAFNVQAEDDLYISPLERVEIW